MSEKRVTIYESDGEALRNGRFFNQAKGYAYVDEDNGEITFTDSPTDYARVTGHEYFSIDEVTGKSSIDLSSAGGVVSFGIVVVIALTFLIAIPLSWKQLFEDYSEFHVECTLWAITAVVSLFAAIHCGFKAGVAASTILGSIFEIVFAIFTHQLGIAYFTIFPLVLAAFGVIPSTIGAVIHFIKEFVYKKVINH